MSEEEYCIWNAVVGRCDSSTDWEKLQGILSRNMYRFPDGRGWIIPTRCVGKGEFRTVKQMREDNDRMYHEAMKKSHSILNK